MSTPTCSAYRYSITSNSDGSVTFRVTLDAALDRADVAAYVLPSRGLALRLQRAVAAGVFIRPQSIATDIDGRTYLVVSDRPLGRGLGATLKHAGF